MVRLSTLATQAVLHLATFFTQSALADSDGIVVWPPEVPNEGNGYSRVIQLQHAGDSNGNLLAIWEHWYTQGDTKSSNGTASHYIIRESGDNGTTWDTLTTISDPLTGTGHPATLFYQPFLFEFPQQLGKYPEGTLLLVGNLAKDLNTDFVSWRSTDHGKTWTVVGKFLHGSKNEKGRIWEPFVYLDSKGGIVTVFSDQTDFQKHAQKLSSVTSGDGGDTWSDPEEVVVGSRFVDRPGMATVAKMDNGEFIMSYEWCIGNVTTGEMTSEPCPIHVKMSVDGVSWNKSDTGTVIYTTDGIQTFGSPYTIWDPTEKKVIVSSKTKRWQNDTKVYPPENRRILFVNNNYGKGGWSWAPSPWTAPKDTDVCGANYSPNLLLLPNGTVLYTAEASIDGNDPKSHCTLRTGAAPIASLPYKSDFSGIGQAGWIDFDGTWSIADDQYNFAPVPSSATLAITGSSGWTDYEVSAEVIITSKSGVVGLVARASASRSVPNTLTRYTAAIDSNSGKVTVYRVADKATALKSEAHSGGIKGNKSYHLSLSVRSTNITVTLSEDGRAKTTVTASDDGLKSGLAGLYGSYGSGGFKNVQISSSA
ncbi:hypothetical protein PENARI_c010G00078 [Penicillium arizonense]|uniref:Uncharacterized protein n=1 Tax=Penicillium arizonense TaxID=1835702 RepID=A0A1F5LHC4_PENAI|nr:hypothetical protein PENARI_c010G00078 [Penicillium arizonense]OGE52608.1 hypothetical protein PENARI_c010G00078 [Penicillium arizonense]